MSTFVCGLDLGQAADYTALVIAERSVQPPYDPADVVLVHEHVEVQPAHVAFGTTLRPAMTVQQVFKKLRQADGSLVDVPTGGDVVRYAVRHIERWKLGTPYPEIVRSVGQLLTHPALGRDVTLVIDATGVGRAVVDLFLAGNHPYTIVPVMITAGNDSRTEYGWSYVPKRELVGTVQVLLQGERLRFAQALPETALLTSELQNFQVKVTAAANETFNAREGKHDDLVLALALACWYGERNSVQIFL